MKRSTLLLIPPAMVFFLMSLSACVSQAGLALSQPPDTTTTPIEIESNGVSLEVLHIEWLDSYQTHYMMNYPPEGDQFVRVDMRVEGTGDPEAWGRSNIELVADGMKIHAYHVRRVLVGDDYEYTADEDFEFQYQYFFSVPQTVDQTNLSLLVEGQQSLPVARLYDPVSIAARSSQDGDDGKPSRGEFSVIAGGSSNAALATHTTVSGGQYNTAAVAYSTVGGGYENTASYLYTTVAGGYGNYADGRESTVAGGSRNLTSGDHSAIAGGIRNQASASDTVIAGGAYNSADAVYAAVGGGTRNLADGTASVISGGAGNQAGGEYASITGGLGGQAGGNYSAILGGHQNSASGDYSVALGGLANRAAGDFSIVLGHGSQAAAQHPGAFLYADSLELPFHSQNANEFAVRATGGFRLVSAIDRQGAAAAGVVLPAGSGSWEILSSRSAKNELEPVQTDEILSALLNLPLYTWSYRADPQNAVHIGPTAEDFHANFHFGAGTTTIASVDADGVALAAIQALGQRVLTQDAQLSAQEQRLTHLESELEGLRSDSSRLRFFNWTLIILIVVVIVKTQGLAGISPRKRG
ncbi:MAG: hypothetical protein PVF85_10275 [Anaerolineales bacterium]